MKKLTLLTMVTASLLSASCSLTGEKSHSVEIITKSNINAGDHRLTPEIMHSMGKVSDPQVSPDGTKILYGVSYTSIDQNKNNRELFVMNSDGTQNTQITHTASSENNARWIEGGARIAYLMQGQLWIMNADGTDAKKVSEIENGINEFSFSPDEKMILFISNVKSIKKPVDVYPDLPKASGRMIDKLMYRHWDHFVEEIPHPFIAIFDGKALSEVKDILEGEPYEAPTLPFGGMEQLSWSPDGTKIAYSSRKKVGVDYAYSTNTGINIYEIASATHTNIADGMGGYDTNPVFSPDGGKIAWISMARDGYEADKQRLFISNIDGSDKAELSANYMYNIENPVWFKDGAGLYFTSCVNALTHIYTIDIKTLEINQITKGQYDFDGVNYAGDKLVTMYRSMSQPNEIVSINPQDGSYTQITKENEHILSQLKMGQVEERWVATTDNKKMHTWIVYPPDFDSTKKYPALLFCMGGPQGTLSQNWSYRWNFQLMAANGYIVILPNRRGTTAFGQEWCEQISGDYIGQNMDDYLSATDMMRKEPYVGKVGAVGASYGGYSVYYLAGIHNKRFSAFIAHAGIFNQEHMYMTTEELWFPHWDNGGAPWDDNPVAKRHYANSPHKFVKKWDTPILVTHGELDYRVPVDQGMAAFNAAQALGVPSEMLLFPDENHWILKPQNSILWNRVFFGWLDKWLKE